jgi:teichuronic acid biosynthesis glycosyltransferase TuaG
MEDFGKVCIIMPAFRSENYIAESIKSVLNQTYNNWELLIDDGSPDDKTRNVALSFKDPRIHYHKDEENRGCAYSRNFAMKSADGVWVALLDSDDLWAPQKLEKQLRFMKVNNYLFSYTNYEEIDDQGHRLGTMVTGPRRITNRMMNNYAYPGCLTVVYSQTRFGVMQVEEALGNGRNDDALFMRLVKKEICYLLPEVLALYRVHSGSRSHISQWTNLRYQYDLYRFEFKKTWLVSWIRAIWNAFFYVFWKKPHYRKKIRSIN